MKTKLEIESWSRKEHFKFFNQFEEPFFGVTVDVDCTSTFLQCKASDESFFLSYLHKSLVAANAVESFRYRIHNQSVYCFDQVHASPTINRTNGTFGFAYFPYDENFAIFRQFAKSEIERVQSTTGLEPSGAEDNVIHYSSLPWLNFTSISHARCYSYNDSCPKISFGKVRDEKGKMTMPVSIHVNHALMDGWHVAQFVDEFQRLLNLTD